MHSFGMANLRPSDTGVPVIIHVYKDTGRFARHAPRVKAFPGKPHEGNATVVTVPLDEDERARVMGKVTLSGAALQQVRRFVERNWTWLLLYWYNPDLDERRLRENLR